MMMYTAERHVQQGAEIVYVYWGPASKTESEPSLAIVKGPEGVPDGYFALVTESAPPEGLTELDVLKMAFLRQVMQRFLEYKYGADLVYYLESPDYVRSGLSIAYLALKDGMHDPMFLITPESSQQVRDSLSRGTRPAGILPNELAEYIDARLAHFDAFYNLEKAVWWDAKAVRKIMRAYKEEPGAGPATGSDIMDMLIANPQKRLTVYEYRPGNKRRIPGKYPPIITTLDIMPGGEPHVMYIPRTCVPKYHHLSELEYAQLDVLDLYMRRIILKRYPELYGTYSMIAGYQVKHPHKHGIGVPRNKHDAQRPDIAGGPFERMKPNSGRSRADLGKLREVLDKMTLTPQEWYEITAALDRVAVFYMYGDYEEFPALKRGPDILGLVSGITSMDEQLIDTPYVLGR